MLRTIRGRVTARNEQDLVVEVASGLGFQVFTNARGLETVSGAEIMLHTSLVVRENMLALYGFVTQIEVQAFERLQQVSGIGPKSALALLNLGSIDDLIGAIVNGDDAYLSSASGVGRKTASKIVIELKDKYDWGVIDQGSATPASSDVVEALVALGYPLNDVREAVKGIDRTLSVEDQIRAALRLIGKR